MPTHLLLDGNSLAYRAWFALQETGMATTSGQQTQAVYGFVGMLTRMAADLAPDGMAVAFDRPEPTFRDELDGDYKAGRAATPEPLVQQLGIIRELVSLLGVPLYEVPGYEADDVLATLACRLAERGDDAVVVTGDRDAFQLVEDPHVRVLYTRRGVTDYALYDEAGILDRCGVPPAQYPIYAALRGDSSDNLPGVPGVGEKTAAKLVTTYGNLDSLFSSLSELSPKLSASLAASEERVRLNARLTPAVRDVPFHAELDDLRLGQEDREGLARLFDFLEMRLPKERLFAVLDDLAARRAGEAAFGTAAAPAEAPAALPVVTLDDVPAALDWLAALDKAPEGLLVVEPQWSAQPGRSAVEGLALLAEGGQEVGYLAGDLVAEPAVLGTLDRLLGAAPAGRLVGHRVKELFRLLLPLGLSCTGLRLDTALAAYLVDPAEGQASLEHLAARSGIALAGGSGGGGAASGAGEQLAFAIDGESDPVVAGAGETAGARAQAVSALAAHLDAALEQGGVARLYEEVERPLVRVLARMEVAGVAVDVERLRQINAELTSAARRLEQEIQQLADGPFNVNSTTQLRTVLYERLGLKPQRKTKTGYSTDAATLEKLRDEHPVVETLLRYREVEKLRSTYGEGLLAEVAPDGRIHASFNQTVARTGRLSSDQPNLHNIPVRTDEGRRFREAFVAPPGSLLLVADYNQIELRVIAHLAEDPGLTAAFAEGRDIHTATAAGVFGVEPSAVTSAQRAKAKMVSYGLAYGMEAYGLSQRLSIPVEEATGILEGYFAAFPAVRRYMDRTVAEARLRGYTETALGRRRYLPELASSNYRLRQAAERQAMNAGIQGLAADIFKLALVRLDEALEAGGLASRIVLQVHDEILVETTDQELEHVRGLVLEVMGTAYPLSVPLEVNLAEGPTWAAAKG